MPLDPASHRAKSNHVHTPLGEFLWGPSLPSQKKSGAIGAGPLRIRHNLIHLPCHQHSHKYFLGEVNEQGSLGS